jgi:hypothetical protein
LAPPTGRAENAAVTAERDEGAVREVWNEIRRVGALLPDEITLSGLRAGGSLAPTGPVSVAADFALVLHDVDGSTIVVTVQPGTVGDGAASGDIAVNYRDETAEASLDVARMSVGAGQFFTAGESGPATVDLALEMAASSDAAYSIAGDIGITGVTLSAPVLAAEPVGPLDLGFDLDGTVADGVEVHHGTLIVNNLPFALEISAPPRPGRSVVDELLNYVTGRDSGSTIADSIDMVHATVSLEETPVGSIARAVPTAFTDALTGIELDGRIDWRLTLAIPPESIGDLEWAGDTSVTEFAVTRIPDTVNPFILNDEFVYSIKYEGVNRVMLMPAAVNAPMELMLEHTEHSRRQIQRWRAREAMPAPKPEVIETGDTRVWPADHPDAPTPDPSYQFVRLTEMSPWVIRSVLTTEDGDFFFHDGINFLTLVHALERNLQEGEVVLGASTLTMQLAKMLFLDYEQTISRKLQEAFLVYLIEGVVPVAKERILELYLNIAEFGPGLYGIAAGAAHYFDKDPADLTAGEAVWLASILPSPVRYHSYYESGGISPGWFVRMQSYFDIMLERGRMTEQEYAEANLAPPRFSY